MTKLIDKKLAEIKELYDKDSCRKIEIKVTWSLTEDPTYKPETYTAQHYSPNVEWDKHLLERTIKEIQEQFISPYDPEKWPMNYKIVHGAKTYTDKEYTNPDGTNGTIRVEQLTAHPTKN